MLSRIPSSQRSRELLKGARCSNRLKSISLGGRNLSLPAGRSLEIPATLLVPFKLFVLERAELLDSICGISNTDTFRFLLLVVNLSRDSQLLLLGTWQRKPSKWRKRESNERIQALQVYTSESMMCVEQHTVIARLVYYPSNNQRYFTTWMKFLLCSTDVCFSFEGFRKDRFDRNWIFSHFKRKQSSRQ